MGIAVGKADDLKKMLIEAMTLAGNRFLKGDIANGQKHTPAGWHDAWFDNSIPGLFKLNCFFTVSPQGYDFVRNVKWSPTVNRLVQRPGVDGLVICDGDAAPAARAVMSVWASNDKNEKFETALYENYLYKPKLLNLEFKIVSTALGAKGKPKESLVLNAHVCTKDNPIHMKA